MAGKGVNRKKKAKSGSVKSALKTKPAKVSSLPSNIFKTYKTTKEIPVPKNMIDQIIGQDEAAEVVKKAARQRRHVLLIGDPGTGKSMLGMALAEMLPAKGNLEDSLCYPNSKDPNCPIIKSYPAGEGEKAIVTFRRTIESSVAARRIVFFLFGGITLFLIGYFLWNMFGNSQYGPLVLVSGLGNLIWIILLASMFMSRAPGIFKTLGGLAMAPKPIITHNKDEPAPFIDATGAHDGALLGDVLHDPLQSGGLGTPPHERVMPGMIHRAHLGVLFIDEIATLSPRSQQELLTALQEKKYPITGQSERSSGSMVRTEPVPCNFIMVAAGNMETLTHMHPALRSRIRGYGYEVHMKDTIPDTDENRWKIAQFVAQEVIKDGKIPHFSRDAVESIILESRKMASRKGHLTLIFRELGGLVRAAGDVAVEQDSKIVLPEHVEIGKRVARTLEKQIGERYIERKKQYEVIITQGEQIGRVNGLAVIGANSHSGIVLSIEAEVTPGGKKGRITATGKLGEIAKEAVINVSAIIKKYFGQDLKDSDIYVQFLQTYEGVEGDSASIAVATAVISALKGVPVKQDYAMTGSLSVRGEVLPVGGVSSKVEAAIDSGVKYVIVPESNLRDIVLTDDRFKKIKIIPVKRIEEVLKEVINWKGKEEVLRKLSRR